MEGLGDLVGLCRNNEQPFLLGETMSCQLAVITGHREVIRLIRETHMESRLR